MRTFDYRHVVGFEDTNVAGNVYYLNHLRWQGRCRELFLREHSPDLVQRLHDDLALVTVRCACDYLSELFVFDEVVVRMRLASLAQGRVSLRFEYFRSQNGIEQLIATGEQEIACMKRDGAKLAPSAWPASFVTAVQRFVNPAAASVA